MPTSRPVALNFICTELIKRKPRSFLDIGIGFGKCGFLAREYMEFWGAANKECWKKENWKCTVDGIEVFGDYITELQGYYYSNIFINDATKIINTLNEYDFSVCTAVLEHIEKNKAKQFLNNVRSKVEYSIFTVPIKVSNQGASHGNEYERHVSSWKKEELSKFGKVHNLDDIQFLLEME